MNLVPWKGKSRNKGNDDLFELAPPIARLRNEMERVFDRFFGAAPLEWPADWPAVFGTGVPALDIAETDDEVVVRVELPGVDAKDLDVTVTGDMLTLTGEKKSQTEQKGENYFHSERRFGSFRRTVRLPTGVDRDSVAASYANGVLTIRMKKQESAKAKKVKVNVSAG